MAHELLEDGLRLTGWEVLKTPLYDSTAVRMLRKLDNFPSEIVEEGDESPWNDLEYFLNDLGEVRQWKKDADIQTYMIGVSIGHAFRKIWVQTLDNIDLFLLRNHI